MYQILTNDDEVCIPSLSSMYSLSCTVCPNPLEILSGSEQMVKIIIYSEIKPPLRNQFDLKNYHRELILHRYFYFTIWTVDAVQDFLIKLGIKTPMHLLEISIFSKSCHHQTYTKIMNRADKNWAHV